MHFSPQFSNTYSLKNICFKILNLIYNEIEGIIYLFMLSFWYKCTYNLFFLFFIDIIIIIIILIVIVWIVWLLHEIVPLWDCKPNHSIYLKGGTKKFNNKSNLLHNRFTRLMLMRLKCQFNIIFIVSEGQAKT